jgi:hypothetical protein
MNELLESITPAQGHAVKIIRVFLAVYNAGDGTGLFSGISRYNMLESRLALAGARSTDLLGFWAVLRRSLRLDLPPKKADEVISALWTHPDPRGVLRCLATEAAEVIMIARMLHDQDKTEKKALWTEQNDAPTENDNSQPPFNDSLERIQ